MNLLDRIILGKETKNLIRINEYTKIIPSIIDKSIFLKIKNKLLKIDTKEHKDKIDLWVKIINMVIDTTGTHKQR